MTEVHSFAGKQISGKREIQEDSFRIVEGVSLPDDPGDLLFVMCDGMGGHRGGAVASELVCDTVVQTFLESEGTIKRRLSSALQKATEALAARVDSEPRLVGMGTTIIAAALSGKKLFWLSVGDSLLWLLREQKLTRLNQDHSMAPVLDQMVESGQITSEEARRDPTRQHLRSVVSRNEPAMIDTPVEPFALQAGDQLVLATDGVMTIGESALAEILMRTAKRPSDMALRTLFSEIESVNQPAQDNASAILIKMYFGRIPDGSGIGIESKFKGNRGGKVKLYRRVIRLVLPGVILLAALIVSFFLLYKG